MRYKMINRVRCTSVFILAKSNEKIIIRVVKINSSIIRGMHIYSHQFVIHKIETTKDVGTGAVEVRLVKTMVDSPSR